MEEVTESTEKRKPNLSRTETAVFLYNTDRNRNQFVHMETVTTLRRRMFQYTDTTL